MGSWLAGFDGRVNSDRPGQFPISHRIMLLSPFCGAMNSGSSGIPLVVPRSDQRCLKHHIEIFRFTFAGLPTAFGSCSIRPRWNRTFLFQDCQSSQPWTISSFYRKHASDADWYRRRPSAYTLDRILHRSVVIVRRIGKRRRSSWVQPPRRWRLPFWRASYVRMS